MIFLFYYTINMTREKTFCNLFFPPIKCVKYKIAGRWRSDKTECFLSVECVKHEINREMGRLEALCWAWNAGTWEVRSEWSTCDAGKWKAWNTGCGYPGSGIRILNYKKEPCVKHLGSFERPLWTIKKGRETRPSGSFGSFMLEKEPLNLAPWLFSNDGKQSVPLPGKKPLNLTPRPYDGKQSVPLPGKKPLNLTPWPYDGKQSVPLPPASPCHLIGIYLYFYP